jgi:hypothetical protein
MDSKLGPRRSGFCSAPEPKGCLGENRNLVENKIVRF